jgi:glycosyltransferase involved in cell wall biosynthesis
MHICFFSIVTYWHGIKGGMDLHGKHLLEGLAKEGHSITVISTKHPSLKEYEEIRGIKLYYLKHTTFGSSRKAWKRESIKKFKHLLKQEKIDVVLSQSKAGYSVTRIAKKMGIPIVTIMHGYRRMIFSSILNQVINFRTGHLELLKSILSLLYYSLFQELPLLMKSSIIIAVSERVAKALASRSYVEKNKVIVINNGIDIETFKPSDDQEKQLRDTLSILDQDRAILFLSLISKQKGTDIAIKALNELSHINNIKLIIAGDGEYLEEAKLLAKYYSIEPRVIFAGFISNEDTPKYYNVSDIFIFPTLRLESHPIVLIEAMACMKPIIASNIGGIPDVIDDGINGILIPPGDFRELARQIDILLNDSSYSKTLASNARLKASHKFDMNRMIGETLDVLGLAIKNKQPT